MNISFRMNIKTSGGSHNGVLFSTGFQAGNGGICNENSNRPSDIISLWRQTQQPQQKIKTVEMSNNRPAITRANNKETTLHVNTENVTSPTMSSPKPAIYETVERTVNSNETKNEALAVTISPVNLTCNNFNFESNSKRNIMHEAYIKSLSLPVRHTRKNFLPSPSHRNMSALRSSIEAHYDGNKPPVLGELDHEPCGIILARKTQVGEKNTINGDMESSQFCLSKQPCIKLNVFDSELQAFDRNDSTVELHVPPSIYSTDVQDMEQAATTAITTVEIFHERLDDAHRPVDYFRLPAAPLREANNQNADLVRAYDPTAETHFTNSSCLKNANVSRGVHWEDTHLFASQTSLNYIVREPSSISGLYYSRNTHLARFNDYDDKQIDDNTINSFPYVQQPNILTGVDTNESCLSSKMSRENQETILRANSNLSNLQNQSFSDIWNLADGSGESVAEENIDNKPSVATILRFQQRTERSPSQSATAMPPTAQCALSRNVSESGSALYSRIMTPSLWSAGDRSARAPPLPPKRCLGNQAVGVMRRTCSQPSLPDGERCAPPRPHTQKPRRTLIEWPPSAVFSSVKQTPNKCYTQTLSRGDIRSASSNAIFKLYQTRDCLGNILYEM